MIARNASDPSSAAKLNAGENAKHFSAQHSVAASVVSELDWYEDAEKRLRNRKSADIEMSWLRLSTAEIGHWLDQ